MATPRIVRTLNESQTRYVLTGTAQRNAGWKLDDRIRIGFEDQLWAIGDARRNNMDASDSKHVKFGVSLT
jgi:hypothetical protein